MSFIYKDENLLSQLLKRAQVAPDARVNAEFQNLLNLSDKLADQLRAQYFPEAPDPNASNIEAATGNGPKIADLNTLGNFLEYMVQNGVKVNNELVVYPGTQEPPPNTKIWLPVNAERAILAMESVDEEGNRQASNADYYVHKDFAQRYLNNLASQIPQADPETQKLMRALLGGLMETFNRIFRTKLTPDYKKPDDVFPDNTVLDNVPNPITTSGTDPKNPLTVGNLKSPENLNAWVEDRNMTLKDAKGQTISIKENYDKCAFINALYARATAMAGASRPETKKKCDYYVKMVTQLASQANCQLRGQPSQPNSPKPKVNPQVIARVMSVLPFAQKDIDFNRIELFFKTVEPLVAFDSSLSSTIEDTRRLMQETSRAYLLHDVKIVPLGINVNQFARMMKDQKTPGRMTLRAADNLDQIIDNTRTVVNGFQNAYLENLSDHHQGLLAGQIGKNPTASSVYSGNAEEIAELRGTPNIGSAE